MLNTLVEYANKNGLSSEPGFAPKYVKWIVRINDEGEFLGLISMDSGNKNGKLFEKSPDLSLGELIAGGLVRSHFLVDTLDVVTLYKIDKVKSEKNINKKKEKNNFFKKIIKECSNSSNLCNSIYKFISIDENLNMLNKKLEEMKAKETDKISFMIGDTFVLEDSSWHSWWRYYRTIIAPEDKKRIKARYMRCFLTGDIVEPEKTHTRKIKGLGGVGGLSIGSVLIGFDKEAFSSYGLEQSENASMSEKAVSVYTGALNDIIQNHSKYLVNSIVAYWYKNSIHDKDDFISKLFDESQVEKEAETAAKEVLESVKTGEKPYLGDNRFYSIMLSGAGGRVMIRDYAEGSVEKLEANIEQWFKDLQIIYLNGETMSRPPKLFSILMSSVRDKKDIQADTEYKTYRAAINNEPLPLNLLSSVVLRIKANMSKGGTDQSGITSVQAGLIKTYHLRKRRLEGDEMESLRPILNEDHPSIAYQAGRLLAVLAEIQKKALPNVDAGIIQRYYASASSTPAMVLGRLTKMSQFHLGKLDRGLAFWFNSMIGDIWAKMGDEVPSTLNLEEQSLFALGYYQQLASMKRKNNEKETISDGN